MELRLFLTWIISGGGAGYVTYWMMEQFAVLTNLKPKPKRVVAFALSAALAMVGFGLAVAVAYIETPGTALGWIERLFAVGTTAFGLATLIHTKDLSNERQS